MEKYYQSLEGKRFGISMPKPNCSIKPILPFKKKSIHEFVPEKLKANPTRRETWDSINNDKLGTAQTYD